MHKSSNKMLGKFSNKKTFRRHVLCIDQVFQLRKVHRHIVWHFFICKTWKLGKKFAILMYAQIRVRIDYADTLMYICIVGIEQKTKISCAAGKNIVIELILLFPRQFCG